MKDPHAAHHEQQIDEEAWHRELNESNPVDQECLHCAIVILIHQWVQKHKPTEKESAGNLIVSALTHNLSQVIASAPPNMRADLVIEITRHLAEETGGEVEMQFVPLPDQEKETEH